jgi:hypothetical protein
MYVCDSKQQTTAFQTHRVMSNRFFNVEIYRVLVRKKRVYIEVEKSFFCVHIFNLSSMNIDCMFI